MSIFIISFLLVILIASASFICCKVLASKSGEAPDKRKSVIVTIILVFVSLLTLWGMEIGFFWYTRNISPRVHEMLSDYIEPENSDENSVIEYLNCRPDKADKEKMTADFIIECKLKYYSDDTSVRFLFDGQSLNAEKISDGEFSSCITLPMFESNNGELVAEITSDGVINTEKKKSDILQWPCESYLPHFYYLLKRSGGNLDGKVIKFRGILEKNNPESFSQFSDVHLYTTVNGEITDETDISGDRVKLKMKYRIKDGDRLEIFITGTDEYGMVHKSMLHSNIRLDDEWGYYIHNPYYELIYDENGNLLFDPYRNKILN